MKWRLVVALAGTLVLSGCAAALMGRAASSGQTSHGAPSSSSSGSRSSGSSTAAGSRAGSGTASANTARTSAQVEQDRQITISVRNKLAADPSTKTVSVGVDAYQGIVSLHGAVANAGQRSAVERVTRSVAGVRDVRNELQVR